MAVKYRAKRGDGLSLHPWRVIILEKSRKNLESCESKLNEQTEWEKDECDGIIKSATKSGATKSGSIPQYGPTRRDRCLSPGDDETVRYTMQYSEESENAILAKCMEISGNVLELLLILTVSCK